MIVYAIRHKPTGNYMPTRMFKQAGSGWSWWEPTETRAGYVPHDKNPRLFFTLRSARNALAMWLKGPLRKTWVDTSGSPHCDDFIANDGHHEIVSADDGTSKHRWRQDMEIVGFVVSRPVVIE